MKPKKESSIQYVLYAALLLVILYFAFHFAYCKAYTDVLISNGTINAKDETSTIFKILGQKLSSDPFGFVWTSEFTFNYLLYGFLGWFIVVAAIENSKKNYIHGKEYGTARWGKLSDIKMLFSENIAKKEIAEVVKRRNPIQRRFIKRKIIKYWTNEGKRIEKLLKEDAAIKRFKLDDDKKMGVDISKYPQPKSDEAIEAEVALLVENNINREWKPVQYESEYKERIKEIRTSPFYSDDERKVQELKAQEELKKKSEDFYKAKGEELRIKAKYHNMDMLLTETEKISFLNKQSVNMNTLVAGGSGSRKTRGYVMPNLLQAHSSFVFTDPKGEVTEKGAYFLEKVQGYNVRVLDTLEMAKSACFNPFLYLHPERPGYTNRVISWVETLVLNTDLGKMKEPPDPFWPKAERMFIQALVYAIPKSFSEEYQTFETFLLLMSMLVIKPEAQEDYNSDLDIFFRLYKDKVGDDFAYQTYAEFRKKAPDKTGNSVLVTVLARMQPFRSPEVLRVLSRDEMHLDRIGEEKTAIFVIVPPTDKTYSFISGMLFSILFQEIQYSATVVHKHEGQRLPVPVRFILDEFRNTCRIPNFIEILAYARSFGVGIAVIIQSLEQLKEIYEKEWGVIVDNCSSFLFLGGIRHNETLNYIKELLGQGTFDKKTTGRTRGRQGSSSTNDDVVGRYLLDQAEVNNSVANDECLLFVSGRPPFFSKKYSYEKHPNYIFTSDADSKYSYEHKATIIPHGEDKKDVDINEKLKPEFKEIAKKAGIEFKDIEFDIDQEAAVRRLAKHLNEYDVLPDDELMVEDGETSEIDTCNDFEDLLRDEEPDLFTATPISEMQNQSSMNDVEMDIIKSLSFMIKNIDELDILSDDELMVDDGETSEEDVNTAFEEYLDTTNEDDYVLDDEEESEAKESLMQDLNDMLGEFDLGSIDEITKSEEVTIDNEETA